MQEDEEEGLSSIEDILSNLPLPEELKVGETEAYTIYRALSVIQWVLTKGRDEDVIKLSDLIVSEPKEAARRVIALYKEGAKAYGEKELEDVQGYIEKIFEMVKENKNFKGVQMFRKWLKNRRQYLMANIIAELSDIIRGTLRLESRTIRIPDKPKIENPNDLQLRHLKGSKRLIPYSGKGFKALKDELVRWARNLKISLKDTKHKVGVKVIEGEGGAGKTRLAYEVIYELIKGGKVLGDGREEKWTGLYINPIFYNTLVQDNVAKYEIFCSNLPKIILIDYFERWDKKLMETFLMDLLGTCGLHRDKPIAVIFVGRRFEGSYLESAMTDPTNRGTDLWEDVFGKAAENGVLKLEPMTEEDREEIFKAAVEIFNRIYNVNKDADGFKEYPDTPLGVILMALLYVSGKESFSEKGSTKTVEVLKSTWEKWEKSRWDGVINTINTSKIHELYESKENLEKYLEITLISSTLLNGLHTKSRYFKKLLTIFDINYFGKINIIKHILRRTGWLVGDTIHPIEPDPVADVVISEIADEETLRNILDAILPGEGSTEEEIKEAAEVYWNVLNVITRAWWRHRLYWNEEKEDTKAENKLIHIFGFIYQKLNKLLKNTKSKIIPYMYNYVIENEFSILHGELFVDIIEYAVKIFRNNTNEYLPDLAGSLNNLGTIYSYLGRYEEALKATEEAINIYRKLAEHNPDRHLSELATSLNNLGSILLDLGKYKEALYVTKESVEIYRELPDKYLPDLAGSLNNLGSIYSYLGKYKETLETIIYSYLGKYKETLETMAEAIDIYRKLAERNVGRDSGRYQADLAKFLTNLAANYLDIGKYKEALESAKEAVKICEELTKRNPDKYLPDLATALNNLGSAYSNLGKYKEALEKTEEVVEIYRELVKHNPDKYRGDLAMSLTNLGRDYFFLGKYEEVLKATKEAVEIRRELAKCNPDKYLPDLSASLSNLGEIFHSLGKYKEALKATEDAVGIYRNLVELYPDKYRSDMATSLLGLGNSYYSLGKYEEALKVTKEAVEIYRELAEHNPDKYQPYLAMSLNNLGRDYYSLGRYEEALEATKEAVDIYRELAEHNPDKYQPYLAQSLTLLGYILLLKEDCPKAKKNLQEALIYILPFANKYPQRWGNLFASIYSLLTQAPC